MKSERGRHAVETDSRWRRMGRKRSTFQWGSWKCLFDISKAGLMSRARLRGRRGS